jgi:hypothetical protein
VTSVRAARLGVADVAALLVVAFAGLVNLPVPFHDDQGFFTTGARELLAGGALYRDFWDAKQPGIFWFYLAAGRIAGFHEIGIHAVELGYMLVLALVLLVTLRGPVGSPGTARLAVVLSVGVYYAVTGSNHLTQLEGLAGLPVFLCLWWAVRATERPGGAFGLLVLSGVAGGVTLLLKLILLPVPVGCWVIGLWGTEWPDRRPSAAALARWMGAVALGLALPLGIAAAALGTQGVLGDALWTTFVHPFRIAAETGGIGSPRFFAAGLVWFGEHFAPVLAFALIGAYARLSGSAPPAARTGRLLTSGLVAWVVCGGLAIVLQRKWWPYHYMLLFVPLGILAAMGVQAIWRRVTAAEHLPRWGVAVALALFFLSPMTQLVTKLIRLPNGLPRADRARRLGYAESFDLRYATFPDNVAFLRAAGSMPGPIYVFATPLLYYLADRRPATAFPGTWWENYDASVWKRIADELAERRPPYIFVDNEAAPMVAERLPRISRFLADCYRERHRDSRGTWFERTDQAAQPGSGTPSSGCG